MSGCTLSAAATLITPLSMLSLIFIFSLFFSKVEKFPTVIKSFTSPMMLVIASNN